MGSAFGLRYAPYGVLYRRLIRPRLRPPAELEPEAPPRFAQTVGLAFALVGVVGYAAGLPNVKNYDGSWTEYGSLVGVPIKLGDS